MFARGGLPAVSLLGGLRPCLCWAASGRVFVGRPPAVSLLGGLRPHGESIMRKTLAVVFGALLLACGVALAADKPGAKDDALIPRYAGSTIVAYMKKNFDELVVPTSPIPNYDYTNKQYTIPKKLTVQGEVTRLFYIAPVGPSALEVITNYKNAMTAAGFKVLFESGGPALGNGQTAFFGGDTETYICQMFEYSPDKSRYIA